MITLACVAIGGMGLWMGTRLPSTAEAGAGPPLAVLQGVALIVLLALALYVGLRRWLRPLLHEHRQLAQSEARFRDVFHALPSPSWIYDLESLRIVDANPAALAFFGWSRDEFLAQTLPVIWPDTSVARLENILAKIRRNGGLYVFTEDLRTHDGIRYVEIRSTALDLQQGPARLIVAVDRSQERLAQASRAEVLERLEEAQSIARLGSWELDPASGLGWYSPEVYRLLGYGVSAHGSQQRLEDLLRASDVATQARIEGMIEEMRAGNDIQIDILLPLAVGGAQPKMFHLRAETVVTAQGASRIHGTLQDVSEREQSRRLLHEREEQFRELVRVLPDGVMILADERVIYANAACSGQFGFVGETLIGEPLPALVADVDLAQVRDYLLTGLEPHEQIGVGRWMRRRDGSSFQAGLSAGNVRYGGRDCKLLVVRDLSEPERMRDALAGSNAELQAMAKRLFSLQEDERRAISRDLHDDIGQAITAIKLSAHSALEETVEEQRREDLLEIVNVADATVIKLRNLSMLLRPPQLDALGLEAALRWQASMLFRASNVRLELDIQSLSERPSNEIEQACFRIAQESLTNTLRHACAGEVRLNLRPANGGRIRLEVSDNGDGFDPQGPRGLGLIVMRERAQTVGGTLDIESAPGAGTRVVLHLPYHPVGEPAHESSGR